MTSGAPAARPARIEVVPATPRRWAPAAAILGGHGERGCWCQYWRRSSTDYRALGPGGGRRALHDRLGRRPAPGVLAYVEGAPVGWCGIGPRPEMERLARSRTIPNVDDRPVWSVVCFLVRVGYRRGGVARALLDGAVAYARSEGAVGLEAYPIDPHGERVDVAFAYVGTTTMFEAAGFRRVLETASRSAGRPRWLMRLDLEETR